MRGSRCWPRSTAIRSRSGRTTSSRSHSIPSSPTTCGVHAVRCVRGMRDQRADALAQILVQYSTRVQPDDVCVIQSTTEAEPLVQAIYEEVLRAGGLPIMQLATEGAAPAFYELANDKQLEWIPPTATWAAENADVRIAVMADANTRALSQVDPKRQSRAQKARKPLMETSMKRAAEGELPLVADAVPDARLRVRGRHVARRVRGLLLPRLPGDDAEPLTAWQRQSDEVKRLAEWMEGKEEVHITAPDTDITLGVAGPHVHPVRRRAQHARRRVLHRPDRGLGQRRDRLLVPGHLRRPRGRRRARSSSRTARSSTPRPSAARSS